jgi:hypothetical protein
MAAAQAAVREQLEMQIGEILARPAPPPAPRAALPSAFDPEREVMSAPVARLDDREPFGRWLIAQRTEATGSTRLPTQHGRTVAFRGTAAPTTCVST